MFVAFCACCVGDGEVLIGCWAAEYSFFDSGDIEILGRRKRAPPYYNTGTYHFLSPRALCSQ